MGIIQPINASGNVSDIYSLVGKILPLRQRIKPRNSDYNIVKIDTRKQQQSEHNLRDPHSPNLANSLCGGGPFPFQPSPRFCRHSK